MVRHLFLHFPHDPTVYGLRYQFTLGSEFLIAPVLDKGATEVRVYLPAGEWIHVWTGQNYAFAKGSWVQVTAPLGEPCGTLGSSAKSCSPLKASARTIGAPLACERRGTPRIVSQSGRGSQVETQRSAKPLSPVRFRLAPPSSCKGQIMFANLWRSQSTSGATDVFRVFMQDSPAPRRVQHTRIWNAKLPAWCNV